MSLQERLLAYLRSVAPQRATNGDIRHNLGVQHHAQIYQETQLMLNRGLIYGGRHGNEWEFWVEAVPNDVGVLVAPEPRQDFPASDLPTMDSRRFEALAREVMSRHYGMSLCSGSVPGVPKIFDLVSADGQIVGDAKYYSLVGGEPLPPAKFSVIAEHVWLLEKTNAVHRFLVFGNDVRVPQRWLNRYGALTVDVAFYFLDDGGVPHHLEKNHSFPS